MVNDATFVMSPRNDSNKSIEMSPSPATSNVFERIIFDACDEIWADLESKQKRSVGVFKQPLSFYRPPNRLKCAQDYALAKIRKLMGRKCEARARRLHSDAHGSNGRFSPISISGNAFSNRRKRDVVDEILIQEMYEEEQNWSNFDLEEMEVRSSVKDLNTLLEEDSSMENSQSVTVETEERATNDSQIHSESHTSV